VIAEFVRHRRPHHVGGPADWAELEALELDAAVLAAVTELIEWVAAFEVVFHAYPAAVLRATGS
jgi:hypothetical protein